MLLTAQLFLNYQRCARRAYLDVYGDPSQRGSTSDFLLKLIADSQEHRQTVLRDYAWEQPSYPRGDWAAGAEATLALMQQGVEHIHQGVLLSLDPSGITLVSNPDLLTKQPGLSLFGDWIYVPTDIKFSRRSKLEYQIILSYHVYLLATMQGAWPETAWLHLGDKGQYGVDLWQILPQMLELLAELIQILKHEQEPEVFIARNHCSLCAWFEPCYGLAQSQQHLSLIPGVTSNRYAILQSQNLTSLEALTRADPAALEVLPGFGNEVARKLIRQAQAVMHNQPLPQAHLPNFAAHFSLPIAPVELYFDIEAEPSLNLIYLHGVLVVDRQRQTQVFYPLLAEHPEAEAQAWQQFLELVHRYPTAPIFHFCAYEPQTVERLGKLYHTPAHVIKPLLTRFVDLHQWVTHGVILPIENYTLKLIARWLGFEWRDSQSSGAQSICWYSQWLASGDRQLLESILIYNEDDCRATYRVKEWLTEFVQAQGINLRQF
jgi:predicted RecB family nuclease